MRALIFKETSVDYKNGSTLGVNASPVFCPFPRAKYRRTTNHLQQKPTSAGPMRALIFKETSVDYKNGSTLGVNASPVFCPFPRAKYRRTTNHLQQKPTSAGPMRALIFKETSVDYKNGSTLGVNAPQFKYKKTGSLGRLARDF
ncbi:hypothetical protein H6784_02845 [Candidatus Nomurabacteria bacterium]|nr:hypothetical protein [Candidatus Nomurabacteria bacterium]